MARALTIQDVLDRIVDFVWDDPAALRACATVARAWAGPSRAHLWASVRVARIPRVEALLALADGPGPAVLVRELVYDAENLPLEEDLHILRVLLPQLRGRLPRLDALVLVHSTWGVREPDAPDAPPDALVAAFAGISTLRFVRQPYVLSAAALVALVAQFPRLRHLSMANTVVNKHAGPPAPRRAPCLSSLHLQNVGNAHGLVTCLAQAREQQIRQLTLDLDTAAPVVFRTVWESVGKDVTDLHVRALRPFVIIANPDYDTVAEASCIRLCDTLLPTSVITSLHVVAAAPVLLFGHIHGLHLPTLKRLTLELSEVLRSDWSVSDMTSGPDVLDHSKLRSLQAVVLQLTIREGINHSQLTSRFFQAEALGLLATRISVQQPVLIGAKKREIANRA